MRIAVAGGTGVLGRHIVEACEGAGHEVTSLSRRTGTDLTAGQGLDAALAGVQVIVDASNSRSQSKGRATAFFTAVTRNLQLDRLRLRRLVFMPRIRVQTVAARAVGGVVAEVAADPPVETTIDVGGPRAADLVDLARQVVARRRDGFRVVALPVPGRTGRAMRAGGLLPGAGARIVGPTFEEWLAGDDVFLVGR